MSESSEKRYCIGCTHLTLKEHQQAFLRNDTSETWEESVEALLKCKKHHWTFFMADGCTPVNLEKAMELANGCADFAERSTEETQQATEPASVHWGGGAVKVW